MLLEDLPPEVLFAIIKLLHPWETYAFAQTHNQKIFRVCSPTLQKRQQIHRNKLEMKTRFPSVNSRRSRTNSCSGFEKLYDKLGLSGVYGHLRDPVVDDNDYSTPFNFDYMYPDDQFNWLSRLPAGKNAVEHGVQAWHDEIAVIQRQAEQVGLNLPASFIRFWTSEELQARMFLVERRPFTLNPELRRVRPTPYNPAGGFVVTFDYGVKFRFTRALYLDAGPEKWHCVVQCIIDWKADANADPEQTNQEFTDSTLPEAYRREAECTHLRAPSFDDWVAGRYFKIFSRNMAVYLGEESVPVDTIHSHYLWMDDQMLDAMRLFMVNNYSGSKTPIIKLTDTVTESTTYG